VSKLISKNIIPVTEKINVSNEFDLNGEKKKRDVVEFGNCKKREIGNNI
jgi:hypothetical protein